MQITNWNDLRYLLAVQRAGTLAAAARLAGVDGTTVSRRLRVLERDLGGALVRRKRDGTLDLTAAGTRAADEAARVEQHIGCIGGDDGVNPGTVAETVRLTTVPIVANRLLVPALSGLSAAHPALVVELIPDSRAFSLTRREADLAVRLARPRTGGTKVKARRIADLTYGLYVAADEVREEPPWIVYDDAVSDLPQARWLNLYARQRGAPVSGVRVRDGETALEAVRAGLGRSLIPIAIGEADAALRRLDEKPYPAMVSREVWLLGHVDQIGLAHVEVVSAWVRGVFANIAGA